ncbi:hypothetical protein [Rhizobium leguminosarum]|uniref:hypothetical protein n=1 Tax=Rhizobium leguminosarum TaxID=384 RepID=UPI0010ED13F6|nr:hypothetical protein [Rhizobium leguminosarum]TBZ30761.1 hypothetical protein E0H44_35210 [Rhizobium leguminosarum bv. viciae]
MEKERGPINILNLFIMGQLYFQALGFVLAPLIALSLVWISIDIAWRYCSGTDFTPLVRAGTLITGIAFLYVLVEEVWNFADNIYAEIEANLAWLKADENPEAQQALSKYRVFAQWTVERRKVLVRALEAILILLGTLLSAFGDLMGNFVKA